MIFSLIWAISALSVIFSESATPEDVEDDSAEHDKKDNLDDDQNVENPAYIPKTGRFYMHDDNRRGDVEDLDGLVIWGMISW